MCRGNRREPIFLSDKDRLLFLTTMGEACERTGRVIHSYVLMTTRRSWFIGCAEFRRELLERVGERLKGKAPSSFGGRLIREHSQEQAAKLLEAALNVANLDIDQLRKLKKNDVRKQGIAWLIRSRTTVRINWISQQLNMGSRATIFHAIKRYDHPKGALVRAWKRKLEKLTI